MKTKKVIGIAVSLHVWAVHIDYKGFVVRTNKILLITTDVESTAKAGTKAEAFLKKNADSYPEAKIKSIKYEGTIDA
jgi:hypothetical protein